MKDSSAQDFAGGGDIAPGVRIAPGGRRFTFSRSSGPGGQAVNKLSTRATLRVAVADLRGLDEHAAHRLRTLAGARLTQGDEIVISSDTSRSQLDNKNACVARLAAMVRQALVRPKIRKKRKPTRSMIEKRLKSKRRQSEKKSLRRGSRTNNE
jgi:ribosome-associated protein